MSNYPWFAFYPADYLRKVGHLPLATQGLWMWMLCRMDESPRRGVLLYPTGSPIMERDIPAMVIDTPGNVHRALTMLEIHGILSREEGTGAMYSRRMVRDTERRGRERDKKRIGRGVSPAMSTSMSHAMSPSMSPAMSPRMSPVDTDTEAEADADAYPLPPNGKPTNQPDGPSFLAFWHAYPTRLRTKHNECLAAWGECVAEGHDPALIVGKAREYGESGQGRGEFAVRAPRFLAARMFLDPPEAWQEGSGKAPEGESAIMRKARAMEAEAARGAKQ